MNCMPTITRCFYHRKQIVGCVALDSSIQQIAKCAIYIHSFDPRIDSFVMSSTAQCSHKEHV